MSTFYAQVLGWVFCILFTSHKAPTLNTIVISLKCKDTWGIQWLASGYLQGPFLQTCLHPIRLSKKEETFVPILDIPSLSVIETTLVLGQLEVNIFWKALNRLGIVMIEASFSGCPVSVTLQNTRCRETRVVLHQLPIGEGQVHLQAYCPSAWIYSLKSNSRLKNAFLFLRGNFHTLH